MMLESERLIEQALHLRDQASALFNRATELASQYASSSESIAADLDEDDAPW